MASAVTHCSLSCPFVFAETQYGTTKSPASFPSQGTCGIIYRSGSDLRRSCRACFLRTCFLSQKILGAVDIDRREPPPHLYRYLELFRRLIDQARGTPRASSVRKGAAGHGVDIVSIGGIRAYLEWNMLPFFVQPISSVSLLDWEGLHVGRTRVRQAPLVSTPIHGPLVVHSIRARPTVNVTPTNVVEPFSTSAQMSFASLSSSNDGSSHSNP